MILIGGQTYDIDAVVFDKDGTLVEVGDLWAGIMRRWVEAVTPGDGEPEMTRALASVLGINGDGRLVPNGIAHTGTLEEMRTATQRVLENHGVGSATAIVVGAAPILETFEDGDITPLGDVRAVFESLSGHGLRLAVATSDSRGPARRQLALLGVERFVDLMVCGDDAIEHKPSPEVFEHISDRL